MNDFPMAEQAIGEQLPKKQLSRSAFIKAALTLGGGLALAATPEVVRWGIEQLAGKADYFSRLALTAEVRSGKFSAERVGKIITLAELNSSLRKAVEKLSGVSEAQVLMQIKKQPQ